jgi:hypothetical protein
VESGNAMVRVLCKALVGLKGAQTMQLKGG